MKIRFLVSVAGTALCAAVHDERDDIDPGEVANLFDADMAEPLDDEARELFEQVKSRPAEEGQTYAEAEAKAKADAKAAKAAEKKASK